MIYLHKIKFFLFCIIFLFGNLYIKTNHIFAIEEKLLQQGLQEQWLPWILLQQVGSFLSIPSNEFTGSAQRGYPIFEDILPKVDKNVQDSYDRLPPLGAPHGSKNILTREPFDLLTLINSKTGD